MNPNVNQHTKRRKKRVLQGTKTVVLVRGKLGFGFTISGQNPCMLSCIVAGSPADTAGLKAGDLLYFVNGQNVSKACHDDVVRMVGLSTGTLELQVAENFNSSDSSDDDYPPRSKSRYPNRVRPRINQADRASKYERAASSYHIDKRENHLRQYITNGAESDLSSSLTSQEDQAWTHIADLAWSKHKQGRLPPDKKDPKSFDAKDNKNGGFGYGALQSGSVATAKKICTAAAVVKKVPQVTEIKIPNQVHSEGNICKSPDLIAVSRDLPTLSYAEDGISKQENNQVKVESTTKAVVGYIGSIETPSSHTRPHQRLQSLRNAVRRLRVEKRVHTLVLMQVNPSGVTLTNTLGKQLAFYPHERIAFSGICPDDDKFFGLVTLSIPDDDCSSYTNGGESLKIPNSSCHIFMIEPELSPHCVHLQHAAAFQIKCTSTYEMNRCEEFPKSPTSLILCIANLYRDAPPRKFDTEIVQSQALADPTIKQEHINNSGNGNNSNSDSGLGLGREETPIEQNEQVCVVELPYRMYQLNTSDTSNALDTSNMSTQGHFSPEVDVVNSTASSSSIQRPLSAFDIRRGLNNSTSSEECWQQDTSPISKLTPRAMPDPAQSLIKDNLFSNKINTENLRQSMQRLLQVRQQQLQEQNCLLGSDGESHNGDPVLSLSVAEDGYAILEAGNINHVKHQNFSVMHTNGSSNAIQSLRSNTIRSAFQVPRPVSAPLGKQRTQAKPETVDVEKLGKLSPRAFPHTSPTSMVFRSPSAPPAPFFPHRDSDDDEDDDDESEDDPYIRQILEQFRKDGNAAVEEDNRRLSEGFALSKRTFFDNSREVSRIFSVEGLSLERDKLDLGNIQKWTKSGSFRRPQHMTLKQSFSHSHESLAVGEESGSNSHKLITACSVNNISKQTAEHGQNDSSGRVASWAVNFEKLLRDPIGLGIFTEFLKKEFSEENIIFWKACEQYRQLADEQQRKVKAKDIYTRYLSTKASEPVNVDSSARLYSEKFLDNPTAIMFDVAQQQIFQLMRQDSYARFLKSDLYKKKLMEEMEGRPLDIPVEANKQTDSKKKVKGKENDDKRRRSILPWKHGKKSSKTTSDSDQKRHSKKEANNINLNSSSAGSSTTTTVTHSNGLITLKKAPGPGIDLSTMRKEVFNAKEHHSSSQSHFKFCRIIMPDGSTTVVCAKPGQTSRLVLSKLCEKRSLSIASVDVFLLGSDKPLDLNEDISTLGSKEIVIERRVLFRLDLPNGKSIGVKAKPNRSIRDVFKPILTKYGYNIDNIGVHLMGLHEFLDLNMSVSDLDNQRAVIIQDVDIPEILRQGEEPVAFFQTKVTSVSRSKVGQYGAHGGSLEEITNKIFEDLMRGKSQLAHGFDELGVLELDRYKVHKNEEGRSLGLFGHRRKESVAVKDTHKGNKLKGKVTFTLPKNDTKKKSNTKEGERLFHMLSSAQKLRLEEQRGVQVSTGDLPTFLLEESKKQENIDHLKDDQKIKSHLSGVNMFDDVDEISKVGFLEKTKRKELVDFSDADTPVVFNNSISQETSKTNHFQMTPSTGKWKSLSARNHHENGTNMKNAFSKQDSAVLSSHQTETYFQMSPLIIDAKYNFPLLDDNENETHVLLPNVLAKTDQVSSDFNPVSVSNLNEVCRSPHVDSYLGTKITISSEIMQHSDKVVSLDNNVHLSTSPSAENHPVSQKHLYLRMDQLKQGMIETSAGAESNASNVQLLASSRTVKHPVYRPVDPPPYKKRSTALFASSPRIHGVVSPKSNSNITTPQKSSVLNGNFKTKSELQFVPRGDSPHSVHPNSLQFSLSSYVANDHEDETVTFV